jgi:hypothetical protein
MISDHQPEGLGGIEMTDEPMDPLAELDALRKVAEALSGLDDAAINRVLTWAADRFGAKIVTSKSAGNLKLDEADGETDTTTHDEVRTFEDVATFFSCAAPKTDADRALVVGYWVQYHVGAAEFEAFTINQELKNLGHGVGNITDALDKLKSRKPQLVIQTKKSGTSRQARKKYKLTNAGRLAVEAMLRGE